VGGSAAIADFPLTLDGMSITSGTATTTSAASHTVAAGSVANYAATFGGNCNTSGQVTVPAGSSASCTVTETYSAPALTAQTITVTTHAPASAANGTSFPVAATASSGLTVAITATGGCTIAGGTVTMNSDTTACVVHYNQAGDSTYSAAPEVTETTTASAAAPACALDASNDLINNPCLETGTPGTLTLSGSNVQTGTGGPDNWFIYNAGIEGTATYPASTFHSGTKAASVTITSVTDPTHEHDAQWGFDTVNVTADTNYQFSFWYNSTVDIEVDGEYDDAANKATYTQVRSNLPATNGQWKQFTTNIIPPKGTTHMSIVPLISQPGTLTVDDFQLQKMADPNAFSAGMVSLNFDDGLASFWDNATSTLNAAGLKATAYIITGSSGSSLPNSTPNGGYLSQAQIQALYAAGYDIGDHTTSHPYLTTVSDLNAEINDSVSALSTAIGVPVTTLAYPYGDYNSAVETQVQGVTAAQGGPLLAARSVEDGYNDKATDPDALRIKEIFDTTTVAQVESWIDDANTNHEWLVLLMHDVQATCPNTGTECITVANLKTIADYLNSSHTNTVTMSQGAAAMSGGDITAPAIAITAPANGSTISTATTTISGTTNDAADVHFSLNGKFYTATPSAGAWSVTMPDADALANGTYTIIASSTDGTNIGTATASFTVAVVTNTAPTAHGLSVSALSSTATSSVLLATDPDASDTLTFATTTNPAHGTLALDSTTGAFTYTPDASTTAFTDSFTFKANDGKADSNTATVSISVAAAPAVNNAPVATAQSVSLNKNTSVGITLAGTDADASDTLTFATSTNPAHGSLSGSGASLTYTPATNYVGSDSFDFTVGDGKATSTATVTITVNDTSSNTGGGSSCSGCSCGGCGGGGGGTVVGLIGSVNTNPTTGLVLGASTGGLSETQINAILDLLRSFNADESVITNVANALHGAPMGGSGTKFVFTATLEVGSRGNDVTQLQSRLTLEGVYSGPITGYFGPLTKAAVIKYQAAHGIEQVGIVGPQTRAALNQ